MKTATLDNGIEAETKRAITWQFDNAQNLIGVLETFRDYFAQSSKDFWDAWPGKVVNIDTADDFGLAIWGKLMDCRRPTLDLGSSGKQVLSADLYRKILKARFRLLNSHGTMADYCRYVQTVFDGRIVAVDGFEMNLTFKQAEGATLTAEEAALVSQAEDVAFLWPVGVKNNTVQDPIAFGYCGTETGDRPTSWDGSFKYGTEDAYIKKLDDKQATFIWRKAK